MFSISGKKGELLTAHFNLLDLFNSGAVEDSYFLDIKNISKIVVGLSSNEGGQKINTSFIPTANVSDILTTTIPVSGTARDIFTLKHIILLDHQGGSIVLPFQKLVDLAIDVEQFNLDLDTSRPLHFTLKRPPSFPVPPTSVNIPFLSRGGTFKAASYSINGGEKIQLPTTGSVTISPELIPEAGTIDVRIHGDFLLNTAGNRFSGNSLVEIKDWGTSVYPENLSRFFLNQKDFNLISAVEAPNLTQTKNISYMFDSCNVFNQNISNWDTSNITNMQNLFSNCWAFNQDISGWDVSKVTNMNGLFYACRKFNRNISSWNVSNVTNMSYMFSAALEFNNGGQPLSWGAKTSKVDDMMSMFSSASAFNNSNTKLNWVVPLIKTTPSSFATGAPLTTGNYPTWG